jgi:peptidoglycan/LPS O-acetylase OafA/YrhL
LIAHSFMTQFVALYVIVVLITIALSTITYLAIEKPMIRLGGRIASRFSATRARSGLGVGWPSVVRVKSSSPPTQGENMRQ